MATAGPSNALGSLAAADIPAQIDLVISLHLHFWTALTISIQNSWGTSNPQIGEDKRDWLAGAISDLFAQNQLRDLEDLEDVLEQVMSDEFEVVVDDGSLEETARKIWRGVDTVRHGDNREVQELLALWEERKRTGTRVIHVTSGANADESDSSGTDDDDNDDLSRARADVDMDEAPALIDSSKPKPEAEVDEDGFTKVVSKKKR